MRTITAVIRELNICVAVYIFSLGGCAMQSPTSSSAPDWSWVSRNYLLSLPKVDLNDKNAKAAAPQTLQALGPAAANLKLATIKSDTSRNYRYFWYIQNVDADGTEMIVIWDDEAREVVGRKVLR